jgi:hypothetical protein
VEVLSGHPAALVVELAEVVFPVLPLLAKVAEEAERHVRLSYID